MYKEDYLNEESGDEYREVKAGITSWSLSMIIHFLVMLLISSLYIYQNFEKERPPVNLVPYEIPLQEEEEEPIDKVELEKVEIEIEVETEITKEEVKLPELEELDEIDETEDDELLEDVKGREDAVSEVEQAGQAAFMNPIGVGGPGSGAFGREKGGDKRKLAKSYGPNARRAQSAIDRALKWLVRHQSADGRWDSDNYWLNCQLDRKCEPGQEREGADEAITGYAVLCFLGAGYDHKTPNKYRKVVVKGIEWILNNQDPNGLIGKRNYEHPVATMALCEAYAMTLDKNLKEPCEKAVRVVLDRQCKKDEYPYGWDYVNPNLNRVDISVSGWNVMALKAAAAGGIDVGEGLRGAKQFVSEAWKAANPNWETIDPYGKSVFPYTWNVNTNEAKKNHLSFVGTLCSVFLGKEKDDIMLESMMNDVNSRWFDSGAYKNNSYCLYYSSLSSFQTGGKHWTDKWGHPQRGYVPWLIETMITDASCHDGTWLHNKESWHGSETSHVLIHTYKLLALEVAIRYERIRG
jgi:hypothetical protein